MSRGIGSYQMDAVFSEANRCEMDSHADTTVCGANFVNIGDTGETVEVSPFTQEYEAIPDIPIGSYLCYCI